MGLHYSHTPNLLRYFRLLLAGDHDAIDATAWNRNAERIYGWQALDVLGHDLWKVTRSQLSPEQQSEFLRRVRAAVQQPMVSRHRRNDGTVIHADGPVLAQRDPSRLTSNVTVERDITPAARVSEELARREAQLRLLEGLAHVGSWEWDILADRVTWSDELCRIAGVERETSDATYDAIRSLVHPDDRVTFDETNTGSSVETVPFATSSRAERSSWIARARRRGSSVPSWTSPNASSWKAICSGPTASCSIGRPLRHMSRLAWRPRGACRQRRTSSSTASPIDFLHWTRIGDSRT
jgi:PAS domain S-box-containing protein